MPVPEGFLKVSKRIFRLSVRVDENIPFITEISDYLMGLSSVVGIIDRDVLKFVGCLSLWMNVCISIFILCLSDSSYSPVRQRLRILPPMSFSCSGSVRTADGSVEKMHVCPYVSAASLMILNISGSMRKVSSTRIKAYPLTD